MKKNFKRVLSAFLAVVALVGTTAVPSMINPQQSNVMVASAASVSGRIWLGNKGAYIRAGATFNAPVIASLGANTNCVYYRYLNGFYEVYVGNGRYGWIHNSTVVFVR